MLARAFHTWERRLAAASKDRVVREFEWGLDWIPGNGHTAEAAADEMLGDWVRGVLDDTGAFFGVPREWSFDYDERARALVYRSALTTPHLVNNQVHARFFEAPTRRTRRAVVVLPQWNSDREGHVGLCKLLNHAGLSALRLTLPYHDARMPPELRRADYIVSANIGRTLQTCRQAVVDARLAVTWLEQRGYERIGILGTSLGSCLALLTTAHEPRIRAQALNHISPLFADVVWRGLSTAHVRQGLEGRIDLDRLRTLWMPISPQHYLDRVRDRRTLLVYGRWDLSFPVDLSRQLVDEFRRRQIPHELVVLPCGHYTTGLAPFKYLDGWKLVEFLRRNV
jgi:pimeloyl-ACP methyl ester carboxylesterase